MGSFQVSLFYCMLNKVAAEDANGRLLKMLNQYMDCLFERIIRSKSSPEHQNADSAVTFKWTWAPHLAGSHVKLHVLGLNLLHLPEAVVSLLVFASLDVLHGFIPAIPIAQSPPHMPVVLSNGKGKNDVTYPIL